jgi:hypothetical protein
MHDKKIFPVNFQNKGIIYHSDEIKNWEKNGKMYDVNSYQFGFCLN